MKKLFGEREKYVLGRIKRNSVHTYSRRYPVELPFSCTGDVMVRITASGAEIFFDHAVFNSYVVSEEENVYVLHGRKLTFMPKDEEVLEKDKMYIFETAEETFAYKKVRLYRKKVCQGRYRRGKFLYEVPETPRGESAEGAAGPRRVLTATLIVQRNHKENDLVTAEQVSDNVFVETGSPLREIQGRIIATSPHIIVQDGAVSAIVPEKTTTVQKGELVTVRILEETFGRYVGTLRRFDIKVGMVADALVRSVTDRAVFVEVNGIAGRMKLSECTSVNTKYVRGVVYKVDEDKQQFEFSVKRYLKMARENELENALISLPFADSDGEDCTEVPAAHACRPEAPVHAETAASDSAKRRKTHTAHGPGFGKYLSELVSSGLRAAPDGDADRSSFSLKGLGKEIQSNMAYEEVLELINAHLDKKGVGAVFEALVEADWGVERMREIFKKWMAYEKANSGDVERVKCMAKQYVQQVSR